MTNISIIKSSSDLDNKELFVGIMGELTIRKKLGLIVCVMLMRIKIA